MAGKRGRPVLPDIELNSENKQAILDYIKQGYSVNDIAKELNTSVKPVRKVYNRYIKEVEITVELDRVEKQVSKIIEMTVNPRENRIQKMHEMLNKTVDTIYENCIDEDGNLGAMDSGDFAMILKLLERDEQTIMATGRLQTVKQKNSDSRYMFNKEKMIKVDEMSKQYKDTTDNDILIVENAIKDIEE
jgi:transposase-like protein